jgi:endo-1,4-beta-xylanase
MKIMNPQIIPLMVSLAFAGAATFCGMTLSAAETAPPQTADLDAAIGQLRMGTLVVQAAPGAEVRVEQLRHEFWFGAALSSQAFSGRMRPQDRESYLSAFLTNFNAAVTENALKWHAMESQRGQVDYATVDAILAWTEQHQIPLRGHNVFWGIPNFVPGWQKNLSESELREVVQARARDIGKRYRGRFAEYDLNNEMLHGNFYEQRLGTNITRDMAAWMRQEDPRAVLFLNDYDITTGKRVEDYVLQIRKFLDQGIPLGGIGVQGHLHGDTFDPAALQQSLDRLAPFKLPVRVTEFNFPGQRSKYYGQREVRLSDDEELAKAKAIAEYYRICFAHPALYRRDWSATPAVAAYRDLVYKQWWTSWRGQADAQGRCEVRAFFGKHRVTSGGQERVVDLKRTEPKQPVLFKKPN